MSKEDHAPISIGEEKAVSNSKTKTLIKFKKMSDYLYYKRNNFNFFSFFSPPWKEKTREKEAEEIICVNQYKPREAYKMELIAALNYLLSKNFESKLASKLDRVFYEDNLQKNKIKKTSEKIKDTTNYFYKKIFRKFNIKDDNCFYLKIKIKLYYIINNKIKRDIE